MTVTRDDVAKLAGVSTATVSYVINNGPRNVAPETRERVLKAIRQLNYHPSAIARSLSTQKTNTVGIVVSDILNHILASIAKSAEGLLLPQGYSLTLCNTDESPERELHWLQALLSQRVDGLLLMPTGHNTRLLYSFLDLGRHIVLMDRQIKGLDVDAVLFDNEGGAYAATHHLIALGHTRIGLINLPLSLTPGAGRYRGYLRALQDADLMVDAKLIKEGSFQAHEGYALASELFDLSHPPTALLVASNRLSRGVLQQIKERGLKMPDDVALCVFDDVPHFSYMTPSITAVAYDVAEFARQAVDFLQERMNGNYQGAGRVAHIPCYVQVRESTLGRVISTHDLR